MREKFAFCDHTYFSSRITNLHLFLIFTTCHFQKWYRGYMERCQYGNRIKQSVNEMKIKKREERIRQLDFERKMKDKAAIIIQVIIKQSWILYIFDKLFLSLCKTTGIVINTLPWGCVVPTTTLVK